MDVTAKTLAMIPLFAGLDEAALAPLVPMTRVLRLQAGDILCRQGEPGCSLYLVQEGRLKVFIEGVQGQEHLLDIVGPDQVLGELALLDGRPRSATVQALTDCVLLALDREPFMHHLEQHPQTAIHLLMYLAGSLRQRVLLAEAPTASNSAARLAHALLFLAERDGQIAPGLITSALRKKDLAAAIGTSEEWVTQMLDAWCREGIIGMTGTRRLLLHDVQALKTISEREE